MSHKQTTTQIRKKERETEKRKIKANNQTKPSYVKKDNWNWYNIEDEK